MPQATGQRREELLVDLLRSGEISEGHDLFDEAQSALDSRLTAQRAGVGGQTDEPVDISDRGALGNTGAFAKGAGTGLLNVVKAPFELAGAGITNLAGNVTEHGPAMGLAHSASDFRDTLGGMASGIVGMGADALQSTARHQIASGREDVDTLGRWMGVDDLSGTGGETMSFGEGENMHTSLSGRVGGAMDALGLNDIGSAQEEIEGVPYVGRIATADDPYRAAGEVAAEIGVDLLGGKVVQSGRRMLRTADEAVDATNLTTKIGDTEVPTLPSQTAAGEAAQDQMLREVREQAAGRQKHVTMPDVDLRTRAELLADPRSKNLRRYDAAQDQAVRESQERLMTAVDGGNTLEVVDAMGNVTTKLDETVSALETQASRNYKKLDREVGQTFKQKQLYPDATGRVELNGESFLVDKHGRVRMVELGDTKQKAKAALEALEESDAVLRSTTARKVRIQLEKMIAGGDDVSSFTAAQNARSRLRKQIAQEADPQAAQALRDLQNSLDTAIEEGLERFGVASGDPNMATNWRKANADYKAWADITKDPSLQRVFMGDPLQAKQAFMSLQPMKRNKLVKLLRGSDEGFAALQSLKGSILEADIFGAANPKAARRQIRSQKAKKLYSADELERAEQIVDVQERIKKSRGLREGGVDMASAVPVTAWIASALGMNIPATLATVLGARLAGTKLAAVYVTNPQLARTMIRRAGQTAMAGGGTGIVARRAVEASQQELQDAEQ